MIQKLKAMPKKFVGKGVNHEGQNFTGTFEIESKPEINGVSFVFEARGADGQAFHLESSLVGINPRGQASLWVLSSNHPGVFERNLKSEDRDKYIFGLGNIEDRNTFREEIHLELKDDSVKYTYFWGMPGGDFAERSGCVMRAIV